MKGRIATFLAVVVVVVSTFAIPAQSAAAAGGNVQVRLWSTSGALITRAEISGINQYGALATWGPYWNWSPEVKASGWWFGGNSYHSMVNVKVRLSNGRSLYCTQALPLYPWDNWETIYIDAYGRTSAWGAPSGWCSSIAF